MSLVSVRKWTEIGKGLSYGIAMSSIDYLEVAGVVTIVLSWAILGAVVFYSF